MKKTLSMISLMLFIFSLGCTSNNEFYEVIECTFDLQKNEYGYVSGLETGNITLLSSEDELALYLENDFFAEIFSGDFLKANEQFDRDFFLKYDLLAVIYHPSIDVTDTSIKDVIFTEHSIEIVITPSDINVINPVNGGYYTYYIKIHKTNERISNLKLT